MEELQEQPNNSEDTRADHLKPWQFKKGQSGNPNGRPPGPSLKEWSRSYLAAMNDEEREDFLNGLPKDVIWKMAEGNPDNKTDLTTKGDKIQTTVLPEVLAEADRILKEKKLNDA